MECLIVTGISGAGKSTAIHALEDMGYYCADNVPAQLLEVFFELCETSKNEDGKFAAVVDARSYAAFTFDEQSLKERLSKLVPLPKILYMDASDEVVFNRYKETRRRHPLLDDEITTLEEAVAKEREILSGMREIADFVMDTSSVPPYAFKDTIRNFLSIDRMDSLSVAVMSFGFKNGIPRDADLVFDVRCLPNPFYIKELKKKTGMDEKVYDYVFSFPEAEALYQKIRELIFLSLPLYKKEGKSRLVIAFGCTGGKHRSVSFARRLYGDLKKEKYYTVFNHRDLSK